MSKLHIVHGNDRLTFLPFASCKANSSGKPLGRHVQMPSVSSSRGRPIYSMRVRESLMMLPPVWVTIAAISIEYQRAPFFMTYP